MYKFYKLLLFLIGALLIAANVYGQKSQGIGTDKPNSRAVLDITVEQPTLFPQGLLLPRLTTVQRNALGTVAGLAAGMAVFDSNDLKFYIWNGSWVAAGTSNITTITGTNIATITTITGGYNVDVPYISIVGINGLVVTSVGASFTINGQNIISSQWTTTGNNIYYDKGNVSIGSTTSGAALSILQDASIKPALQLLGGATRSVFLELGRGSTDATIGVAGNASTISGLASPGDFVIKANAVNSNLILAAKNAGGNILFSTGAADNLSMFIGTSGNVGIGTNSPSSLFDINGNMRIRSLSISGSVLTVDGLGNVGIGTISSSSSSWQLGGNSITGALSTILGTTSNSPIGFYTNGAERMIINEFGRIGVGGPASNFSLEIAAAPSGGIRVSGTPSTTPIAQFINTGGGNSSALDAQSQNFGSTIKATNTNLNGSAGNFIINNVNSTGAAMIVNSNSTTSGRALDVIGNVRLTSYTTTGSVLTVDGAGNVGMGSISASSSAWQLGGNSLTGMVNTTLGTTSNDPLVFVINGLEKMRLTPTSGNNASLAINTTAPGFSTALELTGYNGGPALRVNTASLGGSPFAIEAINNQDFLPTIQISNGYGPSGGAAKFFTTSPSNSGTVPVVAISSNSTVAGALGLSVQGDVQFNNLNVAGSVITVDGTGRLGMGAIPTSPSWQLGGNAISGGVSTILGTSTNIPVGFYTNGTERMQITSVGNVGINNPSPFFSTALDLIGYNGGPALNVQAGPSGGSPYAIRAANNSSSILFTIQSFNTVSGGGAALFSNSNASSSVNNPVVRITASSTVPGYVGLEVQGGLKFSNLNTAGSVLTVDGAGNVGMGTFASSASYWSLTGSNYITIAPVTAVGIGTTTPIAALDVYQLNNSNVNNNAVNFNLIHQGGSGTKTGMFITYSFAGIGGTDNYRGVYLDLSGNNTGGSNINHGYYVNHNVNGTRPAMGYYANILGTSTGNKTGMGINVSGTGGAINKGLDIAVSGAIINYAAILNGGNVGIGTSTPNQTLAVAGNTSISGISYLSSTVGISVNTFTGFEALRIGGLNPSSPKGIVFPYITTVQMAAITAAGLGPLDAGMGFYVIEYKDVTIWDGAQFSNTGGGNNNNNNNISYNWDIYGNVSISGTPISATGFGRLGTADYSGVILQTNNQARISIPASTLAGISIGVGSFLQTVTSTLAVKGDIGLGDGTSTNNGNVVVWLTNSNGSTLLQGTIVVVGTSDDSFNTTTTASDNSVIGVLTENCLSGNSCRVAVSGIVTVNVNGGSTRGQHCVTSIVAGQALSVPVPNVGASIGVFLQTTGGTAARVLLR